MKPIKMLISFLFVLLLIVLSPVLILAALVALPFVWPTQEVHAALWGEDE